MLSGFRFNDEQARYYRSVEEFKRHNLEACIPSNAQEALPDVESMFKRYGVIITTNRCEYNESREIVLDDFILEAYRSGKIKPAVPEKYKGKEWEAGGIKNGITPRSLTAIFNPRKVINRPNLDSSYLTFNVRRSARVSDDSSDYEIKSVPEYNLIFMYHDSNSSEVVSIIDSEIKNQVLELLAKVFSNYKENNKLYVSEEQYVTDVENASFIYSTLVDMINKIK